MVPSAAPRRRLLRNLHQEAGPTHVRPWTGRAFSVAVVVAWSLLAVSTQVGAGPGTDEAALCLASTVSALACCARTVLHPVDRLVWGLFAAGLSAYAAGWYVLFFVTAGEGGGPGGLNYSDCLSLLLFPLCHAGTVLLTRRSVTAGERRALLDAAVVALAAAAAAVAAAGQAFPGLFATSWVRAVYATAYPIGTAVLLVSVLTAIAVLRFDADRRWVLLLVGFTAMTVGESVYAARSATGSFGFGSWLDALYLLGPVLVALAAWAPAGAPAESRSASSRSAMWLTAVATVIALGVLVWRDPDPPLLAVGLAAAAVLAAVGRTVLFVRQDQLLAVRTHEALTDPLTELANRRALLADLARRLDAGAASVLLIVDLDRFKEVNDTLGHPAGDALLRALAARLEQVVPAGGLAARLGGDEFALLVPGDLPAALLLAEQVQLGLQKTVQLDGHGVSVGASVGLAAAHGDRRPAPAEVLRRADVALYRAKAAVGIEVWTPEVDEAAIELLSLVGDLRQGLTDGGQLVVHLQPQCTPGSTDVRALEALVRWQHPERGLLAPGAFLPAAERAGLLPQITAAVLELALGYARRLLAAGHALPIAVNLGAADLVDARLASRVAQALDRHQVPARLLRLEVTETAVMQDPARVVRTLRLLQGIGVGLSLDDYGTGLASLSYLRELPIDELKIDRSFITPFLADETCRLIATSTVDLAHGLGLTVVAEGVEDEATSLALARAGCDLVQGWAHGRPVTYEVLQRLLPVPPTLPPAPSERLGTCPGTGVGR